MEIKSPNIIVIMMDTARAKSFSCYGYKRETTPFIDSLSRKGILFENAITVAPWTLPSHAAIFTGLYPTINGVKKMGDIISDKYELLQEIIKKRKEYITICITNNSYIGEMSGLNRGFDIFYEPTPNFQKIKPIIIKKAFRKLFGKWKNSKYEIGSEKTNKIAIKCIKKAIKANKSFYLFLNYMDAHVPYLSPNKFRYKYIDQKKDLERIKDINQDIWGYLAGKNKMTNDDFRVFNDLYDGQLNYLDSKIGELIRKIKELSILDNTVIIITSDHGENLGEHNLIGHVHNLYDTVLKIPLILFYNKLNKTGYRFSEQVSLLDIFPTILDILKIEKKYNKDYFGKSILKSIENGKGHENIFSEYPKPQLEAFKRRFPEFDYRKFNRQLKSIRTNEYKYIWGSDGNNEMYNLKNDPYEEENLIGKNKNTEEILMSKIDIWNNRLKNKQAVAENKEIDEAVAKRLQALGYL